MVQAIFWLYFSIVLVVLIIETIITTIGLKNPAYKNFNRPSIQPPGIVFSIAWLILFAIIIYAWYESTQNAKNKGSSSDVAILNTLFGINLFINFLWVVVFFYAFDYTSGLLILILLVIATIFLIIEVAKFSGLAAGLLGIYLAWLLFATYLNFQYVILNKRGANSLEEIDIEYIEKDL